MYQLPCIVVVQMTPKSSQGYIQGIHQAFYRIGAAFGLFIPPLVYSWFTIDIIVLAIVSFVILFALVLRKKFIMKPQVIF